MTAPGDTSRWLFAEWFEHWADTQPDHLAVCGDDGSALTYAELDRAGDAVADAIEATDPARAFPVVALALETSVDVVVAIVGASKAHRPTMGLDPTAPPSRLAEVLAQVDPAVVIVAGGSGPDPDAMPSVRRRWLDLTTVDQTARGLRRARPIDLDDLEVIQLTSGSTGHPKAVGRPNRANLAAYAERQRAPGLGPDERTALTSGHQWAGGLGRLRDALFTGSSLHLYATRQRGPAELGRWLVDEQITNWATVPSLADALLRASPDVRLPHLRQLTLSGDRLTRDLVDRLRHALPDDATIVNRYGTTETGVVATFAITRSTVLDGDVVPVGRLASEVEVAIAAPSADGVGEIVITSRRGSPGYLSGPEDGRIHVSADGTVTYRTGDRGRMRPDGLLELRGRADHVVKLRGHRVDLTEVELALTSLAQVDRAAAALRPVHDSPRLTAWVVPVPGGDVTVATLRRLLRKRLPGYMVPAAFVIVADLPQSARGKVDRSSLPNPPAGRPDLGHPFEPPAGPLERIVATAFERVLEVSPVGRRDAFFDLGGDSLQAAEVMMLVADELGHDLPLSVFVDADTPAALAGALEGRGSAASRLVTLQPDGDGPTIYCVHGGGGQVLSFAALATRLGAGQPFVGVQMRQDDRARSLFSVRRLARRYATDILGRTGQAPCTLMGHSYGAVVAQELARQLRSRGVGVDRCVLLDCAVPDRRLILGRQPVQERLAGNVDPVARGKELAYVAHAATGRRPRGHRLTTERMHAATWGMSLHRPRAVDVPLLVIEAVDGASGRDLSAWARYTTAGCTIVTVRGDHHSMLAPPDLHDLAEHLLEPAARPSSSAG